MKLLVAEAIKEFARFIQPSLLFAVFELLGNTRYVRIYTRANRILYFTVRNRAKFVISCLNFEANRGSKRFSIKSVTKTRKNSSISMIFLNHTVKIILKS